MRIAFYAPLKSPLHPVPSGDRLLARAFSSALRAAGHDVTLAARLRTYDRAGDERRQRRLQALGERFAQRLLRRWERTPAQRPDLWFTYHVYHKAPDVIGPNVSRALDIPYVVAEASVAAKQQDGAWRAGYASSLAAIRHANAVLCINPADAAGLRSVRGDIVKLSPFFDVDAFLAGAPSNPVPMAGDTPRLVVAAMMRSGNKLASFRLLARALAKIEHVPWQIDVIGGGEAMKEVRAAFAPLGNQRVSFTGAVPHEQMAGMLQAADLFVWPAVDEVSGMSLLEAQACIVPVVAGRGPGVEAVIEDGVGGTLVEHDNPDAFAAAIADLLRDGERRRAMGLRAKRYVREHHDIAAAARAIDDVLQDVVKRRPGRNAL